MTHGNDWSRYQFESLGTDSVDQALALLNQSFDRWGTTLEDSEAFWKWKHEENPFGPSFLLGAKAPDNCLASLRAVMRWKLQVDRNESVINVARMVDTATHPEHRGRGLFTQLTKWAVNEIREAGIAFLFNTPNEKSFPGYRKLGWSGVEKLRIHGRPPTIRGILGENDKLNLLSLSWTGFLEQYGDQVTEVARRHEEARTLVAYRTPRSLEYLSWRYGSIPGVNYEVYVEEDDEVLTGFVVGRKVRGFGGLRAFSISEVFSRSGSGDHLKELILGAVARTRVHYLIAHFSKDSAEYEVLQRSGFWPIPGRTVTLAARSLGTPALDPLSRTSWDLSLGDIEIL